MTKWSPAQRNLVRMDAEAIIRDILLGHEVQPNWVRETLRNQLEIIEEMKAKETQVNQTVRGLAETMLKELNKVREVSKPDA